MKPSYTVGRNIIDAATVENRQFLNYLYVEISRIDKSMEIKWLPMPGNKGLLWKIWNDC